MKSCKKQKIHKLLCSLVALGCLSGCKPAAKISSAPEESTFATESSSTSPAPIETTTEATTSKEETISLETSPETESKTTVETTAAPDTTSVKAVTLDPNRVIPNDDAPPKPDGQPQEDYQSSNDNPYQDQVYEEGKIILSNVQFDGTMTLVVVEDSTAKSTILNYVDSMQESDYNAMNTPPAMGGFPIEVFVHRNNTIERYFFNGQTVGDDTLGKNLQDPEKGKWVIVSADAYPYLLSLFPD